MVKVEIQNDKEVIVRESNEAFSFLDVINSVDNLPQDYLNCKSFKSNVFTLQSHTEVPIGYIPKFVINEFESNVDSIIIDNLFEISKENKTVRFVSETFDKRNKDLDVLAKYLYNNSTNLKEIKGWRNEKYTVWISKGNPYILVERSMAGLLGIITYGIHINGYIKDPATGQLKFWIPRRSSKKQTWPSMLDNVVAGGLSHPFSISETVLKEATEEANLSPDFVKQNIKAVGVTSYFHYPGELEKDTFDDESSFIVGEVEYLYDIEFPISIIPKPNDGEVEAFNLFTLQQVVESLKKLEFKPNCGLIMVEFLIRHGYINPDNEPNFLTIQNKIHRTLPFPVRN
ncbi:hypothetical protein TBLA_0A10660 [Henningerozyma blattae CBS 6284]|uniref:Nudix hydrolase domain-containing protein n=1 Tax=Henningerozyma blattae (strain ATCC 34711 / CBS 6284 / DSM 70876 / NBRC 10599 / NRRL Y-10934 / UCD 77-7) TaxID=1071380 RepID=I2GXJ2_HENB6|nr:hypothetical protein TBLA_0A10660 [Tetrapisispora blattae CBS 6284]CCH58844.1 hypothetical protein TBLA_0A10660 [Tetrapisispora blattae CBS 6284]